MRSPRGAAPEGRGGRSPPFGPGASPEPPAGAAGTGGAQGRGHRTIYCPKYWIVPALYLRGRQRRPRRRPAGRRSRPRRWSASGNSTAGGHRRHPGQGRRRRPAGRRRAKSAGSGRRLPHRTRIPDLVRPRPWLGSAGSCYSVCQGRARRARLLGLDTVNRMQRTAGGEPLGGRRAPDARAARAPVPQHWLRKKGRGLGRPSGPGHGQRRIQ